MLGTAGLRVSRGIARRGILSSARFHLSRPLSSAPSSPKTEEEKEKEKEKKVVKPEEPSILPGIVLSAATATAGFQVASLMSSTLAVPVSGIPVSILMGLALNNSVGYSDSYKKGITYSTKTILQGGIVAVAAKLSFVELLTSGVQGMPVVLASVGAGLAFIPIAGRLAGLPQEMSLLLTAGTR